MKVSNLKLIAPILGAVLLIIAAVYILNDRNVGQTTAGYQYKEKLFIEEEIGQIDIEVSEEDWQTILDNPTAEEYVKASVTVNGATYTSVGIRAKGNSSLTSVANSDSDRYSLKLDFGQYDSSQTYYGLEKINLNNNFSDSTQMKEFVSYELMEQLGITTPAHSYVKVTLNGEYYGLMLAVEEIGKAFAKTNYGTTDGFIFKPEDEGSDLVYVSDDPDDYTGVFDGVKLNDETAESESNIITMMKEISEGDTSSLDVEQVAKYFALNTALVNMDSYQGSFKHNYYLYENGNGIFSIIPWDYNMSFGGFTGMGNMGNDWKDKEAGNADTEKQTQNGNMQPFQEGMPGGGIMQGGNMMTESNSNFSITEPVSGTTVDARPLLKVILEDEEARALYDGYLEKIATEILTEENVQSITSKLGTLLEEAVDADPTKFFTTEDFLAGVEGDESLSAFAAARSESILKQLAGELEGISGASEGMNGMPDMNGMPNMNGEMPAAGMQPPNGNNEATESEDVQAMEGGQMPNGQQGNPASEAPTNLEDADATDGRQAPPNGQMPNFNGERPEMNGEMGNPFNQDQQQEQTTVTVETLWLVGGSLAALVLALLVIQFLSNRKYKRKRR